MSLSPEQQDSLAEAITQIHCKTFDALSIFVNIRFTDISNSVLYVGGKRVSLVILLLCTAPTVPFGFQIDLTCPQRNTNRISATVRAGPARTRADFDSLCYQIHAAWRSAVTPKHVGGVVTESDSTRYELRTIFILGSISGGFEAGFLIPEAGGDAQWLEDNMDAFKKRAESGDEDFIQLVNEATNKRISVSFPS